MEKRIEGIEGTEHFAMTAKLSAQITKAPEGGYVVYCSSLSVVSQGDTIAEARANIKEAAELIVEVSFERGNLYRRLHKNGFRFAGKRLPRKKRCKPLGEVAQEFQFSVKIPMTANWPIKHER